MAAHIPHHVWGNYRLVLPLDGLNHNTNLRELTTKCIRCRPDGGPLPDNPKLGVLKFCSSTHDNHRRNCEFWGGEPETNIWQHFSLVTPENTEEIPDPGELATRCNYCGTTLHFSPSNHISHNTGEACLFMRNVPGEEYNEGYQGYEDEVDIQQYDVPEEEDEESVDVDTQEQNLENLEQNVENLELNVDNQDQNENQEQPLDTQEQNEENQDLNTDNKSDQDADTDGIANVMKNVTI